MATKLVIPQIKSGKSKPKKRTRKSDAASIVGEELAEILDGKARALGVKSNVLIEMSDTLPYGGAVTIEDAMKYSQKAGAKYRVTDALKMFNALIENILARDDISDKQAALEKAVDDFRQAVSAEKMLSVLRSSGVQITNPVQNFLHPKGLTARAAVERSLHMRPSRPAKPLSVGMVVAKSLHMQPDQQVKRIPSIHRIVSDSVGLGKHDRDQALAQYFTNTLQKAVGLPAINHSSVKNVVTKSVGLPPVVEAPSRPMTVREIVRRTT